MTAPRPTPTTSAISTTSSIDEAGNVQAVIIGVGGFLGIGEKQVAVAYSALSSGRSLPTTPSAIVLETTVDELTAAPDFVVVEVDATGGTVPAGDAMNPAPADPMAPASSAQ